MWNLNEYRFEPCMIILILLGLIVGTFIIKVVSFSPFAVYIVALLAFFALAVYYITTVHE